MSRVPAPVSVAWPLSAPALAVTVWSPSVATEHDAAEHDPSLAIEKVADEVRSPRSLPNASTARAVYACVAGRESAHVNAVVVVTGGGGWTDAAGGETVSAAAGPAWTVKPAVASRPAYVAPIAWPPATVDRHAPFGHGAPSTVKVVCAVTSPRSLPE